MASTIIAKLEQGYVLGHNDEVSIVPLRAFVDCIKLRMGNHNPAGWLGALSFNVLDGNDDDPKQYEKFLVGVRHDDDFPKDVEAYEFVVMGHYPGARGGLISNQGDMGGRHVFLRVTSQWIEIYGARMFFNAQTSDAMRSGIIELYESLLKRQPESEAAIEGWRQAAQGDLNVVRQGILGSDEYRNRQ